MTEKEHRVKTMALVLKPLRCPYCREPMDKRLLRQRGLLKRFLNRKAFPCPYCERAIKFPEQADTVLAVGLFVAAILAPLFHFWQVEALSSRILFGIGTIICVVGLWTQKLVKA